MRTSDATQRRGLHQIHSRRDDFVDSCVRNHRRLPTHVLPIGRERPRENGPRRHRTRGHQLEALQVRALLNIDATRTGATPGLRKSQEGLATMELASVQVSPLLTTLTSIDVDHTHLLPYS